MANYLTCPLIGADPTLPLMNLLAMTPGDRNAEAASLHHGYGPSRWVVISEDLLQSTSELMQTTCEDPTLPLHAQLLLPLAGTWTQILMPPVSWAYPFVVLQCCH